MKLRRQLTSNMKRYNFLTNRVVNDWNDLEQEVIGNSRSNSNIIRIE